ncbi:MAG: flagellar biosynthesis protein FlhF, partial [Magnetococcales bacterium]|nr:flagellar biosynthesis protein FlhF [Magnetococcales bacterium]
MKISTFKAKDMREALQLVKDALGADAVVLSTRRVREKGAGGLAVGPMMIEVTACPNPAAENKPAPAPLGRKQSDYLPEAPAVRSGRTRFSAVVDDPISPMEEDRDPTPTWERTTYRPEVRSPRNDPPPPARREREILPEPPPPPPPPPRQEATSSELSTIRSTLETLEERVSNLPSILAREIKKIPEVPELDADGQRNYGWLLMHGVEEPIARNLAQVERAAPGKGLETALLRLLKFNDPLENGVRVIALVGPTGVGKTTTLAKIAADLLLNRRRSVGMITLDTFRVGAVAQLETYARLLQVRLVVARTASEVKAGLSSLNRCDVILVDTVGSSPYNRRQVTSTGELLPFLGDNRAVLLCMAGNVRETEQRAIFRRFQPLQPTGLIFT